MENECVWRFAWRIPFALYITIFSCRLHDFVQSAVSLVARFGDVGDLMILGRGEVSIGVTRRITVLS